MSVLQESGLALASIIGDHPEVLTEWESFKLSSELLLAQWHAKCWGKSVADEERDAQPPMPVEGPSETNVGVKISPWTWI